MINETEPGSEPFSTSLDSQHAFKTGMIINVYVALIGYKRITFFHVILKNYDYTKF